MNRRWLVGAAVLVGGCAEYDTDIEVYRLVVSDLAQLQEPIEFCLSENLWYSSSALLPPEVTAALVGDGFQFLSSDEVPDTATRVLTLSPIRSDSSGLRVTADLGQIYESGGGYNWAGRDWDYLVSCKSGQCEVVDRTGPGHSSGGVSQRRADRLRRDAAARCPEP